MSTEANKEKFRVAIGAVSKKPEPHPEKVEVLGPMEPEQSPEDYNRVCRLDLISSLQIALNNARGNEQREAMRWIRRAERDCKDWLSSGEAPSVPSGTEKQLADSSNPNS